MRTNHHAANITAKAQRGVDALEALHRLATTHPEAKAPGDLRDFLRGFQRSLIAQNLPEAWECLGKAHDQLYPNLAPAAGHTEFRDSRESLFVLLVNRVARLDADALAAAGESDPFEGLMG